jgi:hypothetical protein
LPLAPWLLPDHIHNGVHMQSSTSLIDRLRARFPSRRETVQVLGVVLFVVFGWAIRGFLFKIPSFTLYFGLGANLAILSYMLAFALLESIIVTGSLVLLSVLLPARWLRDGFDYKGFIIVLVAAVSMILFENYYKADFFKDILAGATYPFPPFIWGTIGAVLLLAALLWLAHAQPQFRKYALFVVEQLSLFTYIYVPLGLIGLAVVLIRNFP